MFSLFFGLDNIIAHNLIKHIKHIKHVSDYSVWLKNVLPHLQDALLADYG